MKIDTSRRGFLSAGLMLPVAGMSANIDWFDAHPTSQPSANSQIKLEYRTLGRTQLKVATVGFGCMITSDPSVIKRAADIGINYFDTARVYQQGNNERMVGAALKHKRKQIVLSTKSVAGDKDGLLKDLDTSLKELGTDYVDVWYLHAKNAPGDIRDDMIEAQQLAKKQGKIRFAGVSTHTGQQALLTWMAQKAAFDVALVAYNFSMDRTMDDAIERAAKAGIGIVGMKVMAGGFRRMKSSDALYEKLSREGAMLSALKWTIKNQNVTTTIPSMTDMDQLEENLKAMSTPFSATDQKLIASHRDFIRPLYCNMCGDCEGTCAKGLPVAEVLRGLMYAEGYRNFALGREHFLQIAGNNLSVRCDECDQCTVKCPHGVHVTQRMQRAQELFA